MIDLAKFGGEIICQPDAFLFSVNDVTVTSISKQRPRNVVFGTEILLKQKLSGQGLAFLVAGGSGLHNLENLNLSCTSVDKNSSTALSPLISLKSLNLGHLVISDQGLPFLSTRGLHATLGWEPRLKNSNAQNCIKLDQRDISGKVQ
ncbi:Mitochondrial biogenesis protein AIM24 protein [Dioscorea alata]|uniref:Mitochondrial biogenesis protein AIM24 protein n=1 Tax=Dioscorea alata TaxID=55571 RepID=A0ACB7WP78_DIOAL|nr:Mitochondrial biogenesis protein AIM24 protein [Dioscorea alata]